MSSDVARTVRAELRGRVTDTLMEVPLVHDVILSQQVLDDIDRLQSDAVRIHLGNHQFFKIFLKV